jgi:hypothetical protein
VTAEPAAYRYQDLSPTTRSATIALWAYLVADTVLGLGLFYHRVLNPATLPPGLAPLVLPLALLTLCLTAAAFAIVQGWIYQANRNAHALGGDLSVTPGWAVGSFWVPFQHIETPLKAMQETWLASHHGRDWKSHPAPRLLHLWRALWLALIVAKTLALWMGEKQSELSGYLYLADVLCNVPLCLLFLSIMRQVSVAQRITHGQVPTAATASDSREIGRYRDLGGWTRGATIMLAVHMFPPALAAGYFFYHDVLTHTPIAPDMAGFADLLTWWPLLWALATVIVIGCWIYRASVNAHALARGLTIGPGWAVGWFFIPIAHLFKPFDAMKETWLASHHPRDWATRSPPFLLLLWWGLWVAVLCLHNMSGYMFERNYTLATKLAFAEGLLNIPLCLVLIAVVRAVTAAQRRAVAGTPFSQAGDGGGA